MMTEKPGLRERKKNETRRALIDIALGLAIEKGVDQVRVEDIADAANVSMRTFNNYFPSKEAAIVGNAFERSEKIAGALAARPANEPLKDSLRAAVLAGFSESTDRQWLARILLLRDDPALIGVSRKAEIQIEQNLAQVISERTNKHMNQDIYPTLLASILIAVIRAAIFYWVSSPPGGPKLHEVLDQAIRHLRVEE